MYLCKCLRERNSLYHFTKLKLIKNISATNPVIYHEYFSPFSFCLQQNFSTHFTQSNCQEEGQGSRNWKIQSQLYCSELIKFCSMQENNIRNYHNLSKSCKSFKKFNLCKVKPTSTAISITNCNLKYGTMQQEYKSNSLICGSDKETLEVFKTDMTVIPDFITPEEELSLFKEVEKYLRKLRYETSHWDDAIHGYRETEKRSWSEENNLILERVRKFAFDSTLTPMKLVHVLDLQKSGYIKAHVDSIRFCGDIIAGLCLLSPSVMRLIHENDKTKYANCLLDNRSLYIMRGKVRYEYTHEILREEESYFNGQRVPRDRRISVICRCDPNPAMQHLTK